MKNAARAGLPIFLAAVNMRAGLVIIGPLIPILKTQLSLSNNEIALLTGIPMACYSLASLVMKRVARLGSSNRIIKFALVALTIGYIGRASFGVWSLFIFTAIIGIAIAILNYELPVWVKSHSDKRAGLITGIYTTLMGVSAGIAVAISVPLAELNSLSWRMSMLPWVLIAAITALYWILKMNDPIKEEVQEQPSFWRTKAMKDPIAWALVFFFGFESMTFYATATWLPTILTTKGFTLTEAALALSVTGMIGSLIGLTAPSFVSKFANRKFALSLITSWAIIGFVMIAMQSGPILIIWLALSNISLSCVFPVVLMLTGDKSINADQTRALSTMMQSIGYAISATGPFLMGVIYELSGSWNVAMLFMAFVALLQLLSGLIAARPGKVAF